MVSNCLGWRFLTPSTELQAATDPTAAAPRAPGEKVHGPLEARAGRARHRGPADGPPSGAGAEGLHRRHLVCGASRGVRRRAGGSRRRRLVSRAAKRVEPAQWRPSSARIAVVTSVSHASIQPAAPQAARVSRVAGAVPGAARFTVDAALPWQLTWHTGGKHFRPQYLRGLKGWELHVALR